MSKNNWACLMHSHWDFDDECYLAVGFNNVRNFYIDYTYNNPEYGIYHSTVCTIKAESCKYLARKCRVKVEDLVDYFARNFPRGKEKEDECMEMFDNKWIRWTLDSIIDYLDDWGVRYVKKEYTKQSA